MEAGGVRDSVHAVADQRVIEDQARERVSPTLSQAWIRDAAVVVIEEVAVFVDHDARARCVVTGRRGQIREGRVKIQIGQ